MSRPFSATLLRASPSFVRLTGVSLSTVVASDNIQMLKSLVREGIGIGILSSIDVMDEVASGELVFTGITDATLKPLALALCVGQARQLSAVANLFLARIEEALTQTDR